MKEKLELIADVLEVDVAEIVQGRSLEEILGWDSFGTIKFVSMIEKKYGRKILESDIDSLKTVDDLLFLMESVIL